MQKRIGNPKYKKGDVVVFHAAKVVNWNGEMVHEEKDVEGVIEIVDAYGTFEQNEQPSYDIYVKEINTLYKHITEDAVKEKIREASEEERLS